VSLIQNTHFLLSILFTITVQLQYYCLYRTSVHKQTNKQTNKHTHTEIIVICTKAVSSRCLRLLLRSQFSHNSNLTS